MEDLLSDIVISSHPVWIKNMVAMANNCFCLAEIEKLFSSETSRHNDVWEILFKVLIFRVDRTTNMGTIGSSSL
jgi:hypothetical protein